MRNMNLKELPPKDTPEIHSHEQKVGPSVDEFLVEIRILKQTIDISKDTCSMYQTDAVLAKARTKELEKELDKLKSAHKSEIELLKSQLVDLEEKSIQEKDKIVKQYLVS